MVREFVVNPETGQPAVVITTHQDIERATLEAELEQAIAEQDAVFAAKRAAFEAELVNDAEVSTATQAVEDKKSELDKYDGAAQLASAATESAGSGGTDSAGDPSAEAQTV